MVSAVCNGVAEGANGTIDPHTSSSPQERYLSSFDTARIELLSLKIANVVRSRLGPLAKSQVEAMAEFESIQGGCGRKGMSCEDYEKREDAKHTAAYAQKFMNVVPPFFTSTEAMHFVGFALGHIKADLSAAFSKPQIFLERGVEWSLSDSAGDPKGFLAKFNDIPLLIKGITSNDVPREYGIRLKLVKEEEKATFVLTEQCNGVQLLPQTFTMKDLEYPEKRS